PAPATSTPSPYTTLFRSKKVIGEDDRFDMAWRDRIAAIAIGLVGGFIVGLTSVGSGTFFGLTMLFVFPLRAHKVVGTDILHAAADRKSTRLNSSHEWISY